MLQMSTAEGDVDSQGEKLIDLSFREKPVDMPEEVAVDRCENSCLSEKTCQQSKRRVVDRSSYFCLMFVLPYHLVSYISPYLFKRTRLRFSITLITPGHG